MEQNNKTRVIDFIYLHGPILPVQISKELDTDIIMAGAMLSELVAHKKVMITNTKRGGSPFYYLKGQEYKLMQIADNLNAKDKEVYELLKKEQIVRDHALQPLQRVALRQIKDFAIPIGVRVEDKTEIFWKWYLLDEEIAKKNITEILKPKVEKQVVIQEALVDEDKDDKQVEELKVEEIKIKPKREKPIKISLDDSFDNYFERNSIQILKKDVVRNEKEFNLLVEVPSKIGKLLYYCKIKNKKMITPADLSLAYNEGQQKNLPILFLSNGKLTKKSEQFIKNDLKGQLIFRPL